MSLSLPIIKDSEPQASQQLEQSKPPNNPWYKDGLRFGCTGCGQCCTGSPGYVWVSLEEIEAIAEYLKLSVDEFALRYLRQVEEDYSLREHPHNYDCVFLKEKKCQIYPVRPKQCRTFPWWKGVVESEEAWQKAAKRCEGINHPDAPIVPLEKILEGLK